MKHLIYLAAGLIFASMIAGAAQTSSNNSFNKNTSTAGLSVPGLHFDDDDHIPWPTCYPCPDDKPPVPAPPPVPGCWPNCDSCYPNCVALTTEMPDGSANLADLGGVMSTTMTDATFLPDFAPITGSKNRKSALRPSNATLRE